MFENNRLPAASRRSTIHPSVLTPVADPANGHDALIRKIHEVQGLTLIDRRPKDERAEPELLRDWLLPKPRRRE